MARSIARLLSLTLAAGILAREAPASDGVVPPERVVQVAPVTTGSRVVVGVEGPESPGSTFRWTQVAGPTVAIEDPSAARIRFVVPTTTDPLGFQVTIRDSLGEQVCRVTVPVARPAGTAAASDPRSPRADGGDDLRGLVGQPVVLDGSRSVPEGQVGFRWLLLSGPALSGWKTEGPRATFTPSQPGKYRFALLVAVGGSISEPDLVEVEVGAVPATGPGPGMVGSESPLARSIASAIAPIPGGPDTAGQVADVFASVADRIPLYSSYAQLQSELVRRLDVVVPSEPSVRAAWTQAVFQPLSQITSIELARIGVDVRPEMADRTLDPSQRGRLQELYRGLADACRPGIARPRPEPGPGLLKD